VSVDAVIISAMKHRNRHLASHLFALLLLCGSLFLFAQRSQAEIIRSFDCAVKLQKDATLDVTETIVYDFETAHRHGIYRTIPVKYSRYNNTYSIYLKILGITDGHGNELHYETKGIGRDLKIKIGDADTLITGVHTYKLHYRVLRAVNFFKGAPEVYWNATGDEWPVPIQQATAHFYPPFGTKTDQLKVASFYGPPGATQSAASETTISDVTFHTSGLQASEGLTFVVGLPEGSVTMPSIAQTFWWFFSDWWPAFLVPLLTLGLLVALYLNGGRDIDGGLPAGVEWYPPKDLSPAEVGTLMDEKCDMSDIIATLLDLAARGYLQIHENEKKGFLFLSSKDYTFVRNIPDPPGDTLAKHEREFLDGIFENSSINAALEAIINAQQTARAQKTATPPPGAGLIDLTDPVSLATAGTVHMHRSEQKQTPAPAPAVTQQPGQSVQLSDLKNKFYVHIPNIRNSIYEALTLKKLFVRNPENTRSTYRTAAFILAGIGIAGFSLSSAWAIGLIIAGILTFLSSGAMPAKTATGSRKLRECQGFARFVEMVEKPRLKMMHDEDPQVFGRLLAYAVVLGVADQWAEGFEGLLQEPPNWYYPYGYGYATGYIFSPRSFMHDMGSSMNTMSSTFQSSPSSAGSGGSGFSGGGSGGGFGGGGGGSW